MQPRMVLQPLTDEEYAEFAELQVIESARQRILADEWTAGEAPTLARASLADVLADRLRGAGHLFLKGMAADEQGVPVDGTPVGWLWVGPAPAFLGPRRERTRWLGQITVREMLRSQGYGRAMLEALHARLRDDGIAELWLRVYDWNTVAQRLYRSLGYELARKFDTDAHLRKLL